MPLSFISETELPGRKVDHDTLRVIAHRYYWISHWVFGKKVLEVGCGPGLGLGWLSRNGGYIVGGDITAESLKVAKKHYGSRAELVCMDGHHLPIKNRCMDVVASVAAIIYMDLPSFLRECHRVLKPGGMLIINTPNKDIPGFRPSRLSRQYYSVNQLNVLLNEHLFDPHFFGAFRVPKTWANERSRGFLSAGVRLIGHVLKRLGLHALVKRLIFPEAVGMPLREELGEKEMRLVETIDVVPLSGRLADRYHRIVYAIAKAR